MHIQQGSSSHNTVPLLFISLCLYIENNLKKVKLVSERPREGLAVSSLRNNLLFKYDICSHRYTVKVQRELELDVGAIQALTEDRKRFLCKAVENYISCLLSGEEHDMWIFRLCSLWLENSGVDRVNEMMKVYVCSIFLLML